MYAFQLLTQMRLTRGIPVMVQKDTITIFCEGWAGYGYEMREINRKAVTAIFKTLTKAQ